MLLHFLDSIRKIKILLRDKDYSLFNYDSYEDYKATQIFHNKRKIDSVWSDTRTLERVKSVCISDTQVLGLCHGTRNGYELSFFNKWDANFLCIGTDISETALNYENSYVWDFHKIKLEWINKFDFVYSNSLDHSYDPSLALTTWLNQIKNTGQVIIELTKKHGVAYQSKMDPFGIKPQYFPFLVTSYFGDQITVSHTVDKKSNMDVDSFLFFIKKNVASVRKIV